VSDIWNHLKLVERIAKRVGVDPDLVAELGLQVLQDCEKNHDESRGSFSTYAMTALRNAFVRYKKAKKEVPILEGEDFRHIQVPALNVTGDVPMSIEELQALLSEEEYELIHDWYCSDKSREELTHKYGMLRQSLWAKVQRIMKRFVAWVAHFVW